MLDVMYSIYIVVAELMAESLITVDQNLLNALTHWNNNYVEIEQSKGS